MPMRCSQCDTLASTRPGVGLQQRVGQQRLDGLVAVAAQFARGGLVPHIVARGAGGAAGRGRRWLPAHGAAPGSGPAGARRRRPAGPAPRQRRRWSARARTAAPCRAGWARRPHTPRTRRARAARPESAAPRWTAPAPAPPRRRWPSARSCRQSARGARARPRGAGIPAPSRTGAGGRARRASTASKPPKWKKSLASSPPRFRCTVRSGAATVCLSSSRLCSSVDLPDELVPSSMVTGASCTGRCRARP
jgi:hypothetical protein